MIINLPTKRTQVTNISKSFSLKIMAETSWHIDMERITSLSAYV